MKIKSFIGIILIIIILLMAFYYLDKKFNLNLNFQYDISKNKVYDKVLEEEINEIKIAAKLAKIEIKESDIYNNNIHVLTYGDIKYFKIENDNNLISINSSYNGRIGKLADRYIPKIELYNKK